MAKSKGGERPMKKQKVADMLVNLFQCNPGKRLDLKTIFRELGLKTHPTKMLCVDVLDDMTLAQYIIEEPRFNYTFNGKTNTMEGIFRRKANGKHLFETGDGSVPYTIREENSMHALDGEKVRVVRVVKRRDSSREVAVVEILEHVTKQYVGTLQINKGIAYLLVDDRTLGHDIFIPTSNLKKGKDGEKAVVRIIDWPADAKNPVGKVIDVLGKQGDNDTEMHAILAEYGLPYSYPDSVEKAANNIPAAIPEEEIKSREDMRDVMTFTIDPRDAKDFDDAISIRHLKDNLWEVGVHIADVSYYVTEGSIIDKEAYKRATSVYLVDRTIPMLPERLCNFICSLRPDEDKLAYSVIFTLDEEAKVRDWHLAHTVIRSNRRFTYEEVQEVLEAHHEASEEDYKNPGDHYAPITPDAEPAEHFSDDLIRLNRMAKELRRRRFEAGSVDFDRNEVRFEIDEKGKPTSVYFKVAKDANKLVEEFMLLANRTVAESIGKHDKNKKAKVLPYRIHDLPDPGKLMNLADFVKKFGYKMRATGNKQEVTRSINKLLDDVKGKREQNLVETISLRAMMKAKYSTTNIGHYGLAFDYYTHFTSPIRRYPDLMVHRLLTRYAEGGRSALQEKYEDMCEHCNDMEQTAASAERASIKYKQVEFMSDRMGETFTGTISGVNEFGFYVEVNENKCEGMVSVRDLEDDMYIFDERNYCLRGRRHRHVYALGDTVKVQVMRADLYHRQLDYKLVRE